MKKLFLSAVAIAALCSGKLYAQPGTSLRIEKMKIENQKQMLENEIHDYRVKKRREEKDLVSDFTINQFESDFPMAKNVAFTREGDFDVAMYTVHGKRYKAYYDYNSELVGTTTNKTWSELPAEGRREIKKDYPGYKVQRILKFEDNQANDQNMWLYGTEFEDADNYFVELNKDNKKIVLQVSPEGWVSFFKDLG